MINTPVTLNIDVGYGEIDGSALQGSLGSSLYYEKAYSYSQIESALAAHANSTIAQEAVASLPISDPSGGGWYYLTLAQTQALGLVSGTSLDGYIGFSNASNIFDYNNTGGVAAGQYDFFGAVAHEISEVMVWMIPGAGAYSIMDLFDYTAPGTRDLSGAPPGYFSINGGTTNLDSFNTNANGDYGDWAASAGNDAYLAFANPGVTLSVSAADLTVMNAIGWNVVGPSAPTITTDAINANNSVTLNGTAEANSTIVIYDGTTVLGTTTVADFRPGVTQPRPWRTATTP